MQQWKLISVILTLSVMTGCQLPKFLTGEDGLHRYADLSFLMLNKKPENSLVELHCSGGTACEFAQVNGVDIIDATTRLPMPEALNKSMVRYEVNGLKESSQAQYYVALTPGQNEVRVRFYPVTQDRAEHFSIIHNFRSDRVYQVKLFRQRSLSSGSLLSLAAPGTLCVDLLEDDTLERRFCRPFDPLTGLGEFVEQRVDV